MSSTPSSHVAWSTCKLAGRLQAARLPAALLLSLLAAKAPCQNEHAVDVAIAVSRAEIALGEPFFLRVACFNRRAGPTLAYVSAYQLELERRTGSSGAEDEAKWADVLAESMALHRADVDEPYAFRPSLRYGVIPQGKVQWRQREFCDLRVLLHPGRYRCRALVRHRPNGTHEAMQLARSEWCHFTVRDHAGHAKLIGLSPGASTDAARYYRERPADRVRSLRRFQEYRSFAGVRFWETRAAVPQSLDEIPGARERCFLHFGGEHTLRSRRFCRGMRRAQASGTPVSTYFRAKARYLEATLLVRRAETGKDPIDRKRRAAAAMKQLETIDCSSWSNGPTGGFAARVHVWQQRAATLSEDWDRVRRLMGTYCRQFPHFRERSLLGGVPKPVLQELYDH